MALSADAAEKVEALYLERLETYFQGSLKFDPIVLEPARDSQGKDTFQVDIVYEGKGKHPDPKIVLAVMTSMSDDFEALGLPPVLIESYIPKEEYPELLRLRRQMPWDMDVDGDEDET